GILSKHSADAGFGQFVDILKWVCFRRDLYFAKVNKDGTSQTCPNCGSHTGKKTLDVRVHHQKFGSETPSFYDGLIW
ncbi:zinc ribbon domain-containing protein, partial [Crocosphaera watsonii]